MKDIDRANILDGLVIEIVFGKVEKSGVEKPSFRGGDIIISPPGTDRVKEGARSFGRKEATMAAGVSWKERNQKKVYCSN